MDGRIHSYETMGLHDGPGIRTVFFLQGCPLKCLYCHNPDTQNFQGGTLISAKEVVAIAKRYKPFYRRSGGGVTISGGEPLLQWEFLKELFPMLKKEGISIALDTSGHGGGNDSEYDGENDSEKELTNSTNPAESLSLTGSARLGNSPLDEDLTGLLAYVDHLLMDIKHVSEPEHMRLTGKSMEGVYRLLREIPRFRGEVWVRHVMVPGYTDNTESMQALYEILVPYQHRIQKVEILPYHKMGIGKYEDLGRKDPLMNTPPMDVDKAREFELSLEKLLRFTEESETG